MEKMVKSLWRWLLALGLAIGLGGACQPLPKSISPPVPIASTQSIAVPQPIATPLVNASELWQNLERLSFERFQPGDRQLARTYITETLTRYGWQVRRQLFDRGGVNLIATRPQAQPYHPRLLVVAHYDSFPGSPGSDDNATGVTAALEVARLWGDRATAHNLEIILFDQEEQGLLGSIAYTAQPQNLNDIIGVINLEMLGYACNQPGCQTYPQGMPVTPPNNVGDFLAVVGDQEHPQLLGAFANLPAAPPIVTVPVPFKGVFTPDVLRSDHAPFWAQNIGAVMVTDTANLRNPHYHQASDTVTTIQRAFFIQSVQQVAHAVNRLLNVPLPE